MKLPSEIKKIIDGFEYDESKVEETGFGLYTVKEKERILLITDSRDTIYCTEEGPNYTTAYEYPNYDALKVSTTANFTDSCGSASKSSEIIVKTYGLVPTIYAQNLYDGGVCYSNKTNSCEFNHIILTKNHDSINSSGLTVNTDIISEINGILMKANSKADITDSNILEQLIQLRSLLNLALISNKNYNNYSHARAIIEANMGIANRINQLTQTIEDMGPGYASKLLLKK